MTDGVHWAKVSGGLEVMPMVTGLGCAQTALMGAYAASSSAFDAALGALVRFKVAGSRAAQIGQGPDNFQMHFLDALAATEPADLAHVIQP